MSGQHGPREQRADRCAPALRLGRSEGHGAQSRPGRGLGTAYSDHDLVVVDVAAADDATALAFQQLLADRWAPATAETTTRDAGQPGVRLRCYLDLRQPIGPVTAPAARLEVSAAGRQ
ncbi:DUF6207 family protein [Streptomyces pharetrae]|uniref:DUF6207 family protein n=1 Tax=Streptomyces pharetrae TaxID=291370 RepID=UPI00296E2B03